MPYAWVITRDRSAELNPNSRSEVGTEGPSNAPDELLDQAKLGVGVRFRLTDEGDIDECYADAPGAVTRGHETYGLVYEGIILDPFDEWPFGPLDDFGRPNYGCVGIQLFNDETGKFEEV